MTETSRTLNTKRNIIWGLLQRALSVLMPFFVRTALIYQLGISYVGLNSFYLSVLGVLNLAELGFGSAIAFCMYEPIAKKDHVTVVRLLSYFKKAYRIIGLSIFLLGLALMPFLGDLVTGERPEDMNLQAGFAIYLVNVSISYLMFGYRQTLLSANQRNDVVSRIQSIILILLNGAQIVGLLLFPNFYLFLVLAPVCTVIQNLLLYVASNRLFPEYKENGYLNTGLSTDERKEIKKRVLGVFTYKACQIVRDSSDTIFISMFLGLTIVGCYSNYFMIIRSVHLVLGTIGTSMTAPVGHSIVSESREKNFNDLRLFMFMYSGISAVCLACLLCLTQSFMELWVGKDLMLPDNIVWLLCGYFLMCVIGDMRSVYVDATGLWWKLKGRSIIEALLNIVLNFVLIQLMGLAGVIVATILSMFLVNYLWGSEVIFTNYFKNGGLITFFKDNLIYVVASAVCCVVPYVILNAVTLDPFMMFVVGAVVAIVVSASIWLLLFFRSNRLRRTFEFVRLFLKSSSNTH